jgi:DNA polymerase-3 subunit epsilon
MQNFIKKAHVKISNFVHYMKYAIVDIETTGYSNSCNNITEIAILVHDGEKVIDSFQSLVNPKTSINPYVVNLTGISNDMLRNAPVFSEIAGTVWKMTEDAVFVAHSVNFDYSMIRAEFKSFGADFTRKKLCTVRLSRKLFPGHASYSLGKICDALGITIRDRHRAMGDAKATVQLLEHCLKNDRENTIEKSLKKNSKEAILPPNLDRKDFDSLPEKTGVYYFHNKDGKVIYVGKALNIKKRIYSHFTGNGKSRLSFLDHIHKISFTVTGGELIALLLESDQIKTLYPLYNKAQKKSGGSFCICTYIDKKGIHHLAMSRITKGIEPLIGFDSFVDAQLYMTRLMERFELCPKYCGIQASSNSCFGYQVKKCKGVCAGEEKVEIYNQRVEDAIREIKSDLGDLILSDKGRNPDEKSIVLIEKGVYKGFGYLDSETLMHTIEQAREHITLYKDNYDIRKILKGWMQKNKGLS